MDAAAFDRHEADPARRRRLGNIVDRKPGGPVALRSAGLACGRGGADDISDLSAIIGAFVGKLGGGKHVLGVHHQQQVVVGLQMDIPGAGRGRNVIYGVSDCADRVRRGR